MLDDARWGDDHAIATMIGDRLIRSHFM